MRRRYEEDIGRWRTTKPITAPLHKAAAGHDMQTFYEAVEASSQAELNAKDEKGKTPLHHAASAGNNKFIGILLERGAKADEADTDGKTPLHYASAKNPESVNKLLKKGADANAKDNTGKTPLHYAAPGGNESTILCLLKAEADANSEDNRGKKPSEYAKTAYIKTLFEKHEKTENKEVTPERTENSGKKPSRLAAFFAKIARALKLRRGTD